MQDSFFSFLNFCSYLLKLSMIYAMLNHLENVSAVSQPILLYLWLYRLFKKWGFKGIIPSVGFLALFYRRSRLEGSLGCGEVLRKTLAELWNRPIIRELEAQRSLENDCSFKCQFYHKCKLREVLRKTGAMTYLWFYERPCCLVGGLWASECTGSAQILLYSATQRLIADWTLIGSSEK